MAIFSRWISLGADVAKMDLARSGCGKNGSKNEPRRIKMSKNEFKEFKIPENGSRSVRMREKWISLGENGASGLQKLILGSQGGPKMEPRWLKMEPRWPKMGPRWFKMEPRGAQDGAKMAPDGAKMGQDEPR